MYLTLTNPNGFPYASVYCDKETFKQEFYDLNDWLERQGYERPTEVLIADQEIWKCLPGYIYQGTLYHNGVAWAHVYREDTPNSYYVAMDNKGFKHFGSDKKSLLKELKNAEIS